MSWQAHLALNDRREGEHKVVNEGQTLKHPRASGPWRTIHA